MHKIKGEARREAWREGTNPWGRSRSKSGPIDEEAARVTTNKSENFITSWTERKRRTQNQEEGFSPHHANTMPSSSGKEKEVLNGNIDSSSSGPGSQQPSQDTSDGLREVNLDTPAEPAQTRRRKKFIRNPFKKNEEPPKRPGLEGARRTSSFFKVDKQSYTIKSQIRGTLLNSWINILLIFVPAGIALHYAHVKPVVVFVVNFIAIIPLAAMLSYATEEIALRVGETFGGLLNATFGNAVELIVSVLALVDNQIDIVQESLIGSILSNLLLVLGMSFFLGGITRVRQHFNLTVAQTASSLLALAVGSLIIPAAFEAYATEPSDGERKGDVTALSRGTAIILLIVYGAYLFFQLKTHIAIYNAPSQKVEKRSKLKAEGKFDEAKGVPNAGINRTETSMTSPEISSPLNAAPHASEKVDPANAPDEADEEHGPETPQLSKVTALATLAISTALVALCAEGMVNSIDAITESGGISRTFVGLILLPIVGNAAEHATAVTVAMKDKMDLAIGVAVGSSMQIALLVIPFMVILGWILGKEDMNLAFDTFQIIVLFVSILLVNYLIQDGESHWLEGLLLFMLYIIIAVSAYYYPQAGTSGNHTAARRKL